MEIKTVYDLKHEYYKKNPDGHWFDRETLKFFGQRMQDMYLYKNTEKVADYRGVHECYCVRHVIRNGISKPMTRYAYFDVDTLKEVFPPER